MRTHRLAYVHRNSCPAQRIYHFVDGGHIHIIHVVNVVGSFHTAWPYRRMENMGIKY